MTEYRKLPRGTEMIGTLGLGMGGIQSAPPEEIEAVVSQAIENGINFFDLCAGGASVYEPFGRAIRGKREKVYFQLHFGAVYNAAGEYGWSRDLSEIRRTFAWEMKALGADHADFGFLHCIDEESDFEEICANGIFDYVRERRREELPAVKGLHDGDADALRLAAAEERRALPHRADAEFVALLEVVCGIDREHHHIDLARIEQSFGDREYFRKGV